MCHFCLPMGPKNTNLELDVEIMAIIMLPVKFRWIPFSGFRGEVKKVSANQKSGWPSCFSNPPEKHKLFREEDKSVKITPTQIFPCLQYRFPWGICNGCGVLTGDAYSSRHLVLSHFGTCMCSNVETNLSWTCLVSGLLNFEHHSVLLFCLVEDVVIVEILIPVKLGWILFRGEVKNVSAKFQRPGPPSCFSDRPSTKTW